MRYFYALIYVITKAFGWCLVSFSILWLLFFGFLSDLATYFLLGSMLLFLSSIALDKARKEG